jgi:subtilisin family serine protease
VLDLRDFSGEGRVPLTPTAPDPDGPCCRGRRLAGARRVGRIGQVGVVRRVFRELALGPAPAADVNGNGTNTDEFPLVIVRASDGWVVFLDTNRDGSLEDEMPLHDYRHARETISPGSRPLTLAANLADSSGVPSLDLYFDTSGHGTFVAGVAAGHNMFNVAGFQGVAPGARLLGLKIANNARGGISVSGSFVRALEYAARFAAERNLPLVANLSFGVGNEREGRATIDSLVDAFLARHPDVVLAVSAGNDGPGLSTIGFPATADRVFTVGSTFPGVFARPGGPATPERVASWSARGGETTSLTCWRRGWRSHGARLGHGERGAGRDELPPRTSRVWSRLSSPRSQEGGTSTRRR